MIKTFAQKEKSKYFRKLTIYIFCSFVDIQIIFNNNIEMLVKLYITINTIIRIINIRKYIYIRIYGMICQIFLLTIILRILYFFKIMKFYKFLCKRELLFTFN